MRCDVDKLFAFSWGNRRRLSRREPRDDLVIDVFELGSGGIVKERDVSNVQALSVKLRVPRRIGAHKNTLLHVDKLIPSNIDNEIVSLQPCVRVTTIPLAGHVVECAETVIAKEPGEQ